MEKYTVTIVNIETKVLSECVIFADEAETTDNIVLTSHIGDKEISASDYNYLPAYQKLHNKFLEMGYGIKCNGSRLNAVQSGMMGSNDKIYLVELGKQALNKDIASLYEYAEISEFPDTKQQMKFFEKWIESIS